MQKGVSILAVVIIIIVVAVVSAGGVLLYQYLTTQQGGPTQSSITVTSPNGGETWTKGQKVQITWNAAKEIKSVNIRLAISGNEEGQNFNAAIASDVSNSGHYEWTVQDLYAEVLGINALPASDKYILTIEDKDHNNIYDMSDASFSIVASSTQPAITVTSPTANQTIKSPVKISGNSATWEGTVNIKIKDNNNKILANTFTMGGGAPGPAAPFSKDVVYTAPSASQGVVEVFEVNQKDGSETNKVSIPVTFGDYKPDLTAVWKTYTNTQYGYQIKYPTDWSIENISSGISIGCDWRKTNPCTGLKASDIQIGAGTGRGLSILVKQISFEDFKKDYVIKNQENYSLDGINGWKFVGGAIIGIGLDYNMIFVTKNSNSYIIKYPPQSLPIEEQMLSTFKFTK